MAAVTGATQRLVSQDKRRTTTASGYDLDLSYVTPRLVACGLPASVRKGGGLLRNRIGDVLAYLDETHGTGNWLLVNVSEETYSHARLPRGQALWCGWPDHHAPPLARLIAGCEHIRDWLAADEKHVVAVHCLAGRGRTGVMVSAYLLFDRAVEGVDTPEAALDFFAKQRSVTSKGVKTPAQRRYVRYFHQLLEAVRAAGGHVHDNEKPPESAASETAAAAATEAFYAAASSGAGVDEAVAAAAAARTGAAAAAAGGAASAASAAATELPAAELHLGRTVAVCRPTRVVLERILLTPIPNTADGLVRAYVEIIDAGRVPHQRVFTTNTQSRRSGMGRPLPVVRQADASEVTLEVGAVLSGDIVLHCRHVMDTVDTLPDVVQKGIKLGSKTAMKGIGAARKAVGKYPASTRRGTTTMTSTTILLFRLGFHTSFLDEANGVVRDDPDDPARFSLTLNRNQIEGEVTGPLPDQMAVSYGPHFAVKMIFRDADAPVPGDDGDAAAAADAPPPRPPKPGSTAGDDGPPPPVNRDSKPNRRALRDADALWRIASQRLRLIALTVPEGPPVLDDPEPAPGGGGGGAGGGGASGSGGDGGGEGGEGGGAAAGGGGGGGGGADDGEGEIVLREEAQVSFEVRAPGGGDPLSLTLPASTLVDSVRADVFEHTGLAPDQQVLTHADAVMVTGSTLRQCGVVNGSVVNVTLSNAPIAFQVATLTGAALHLSLPPSTTIKDLKAVVFRRLGHPADSQVLSYRDVSELTDDSTLADNEVFNGAVLRLMLKTTLPE